MKTFHQFHDGFCNGLRIEGKSVAFFLETYARERFVLLAAGVSALSCDDVWEGNIIFDVVIRSVEEIGADDIREVYRLDSSEQADLQAHRALAKAKENASSFLAISPSYGACALTLADSFTLMSESEWLARLPNAKTAPRCED